MLSDNPDNVNRIGNNLGTSPPLVVGLDFKKLLERDSQLRKQRDKNNQKRLPPQAPFLPVAPKTIGIVDASNRWVCKYHIDAAGKLRFWTVPYKPKTEGFEMEAHKIRTATKRNPTRFTYRSARKLEPLVHVFDIDRSPSVLLTLTIPGTSRLINNLLPDVMPPIFNKLLQIVRDANRVKRDGSASLFQYVWKCERGSRGYKKIHYHLVLGALHDGASMTEVVALAEKLRAAWIKYFEVVSDKTGVDFFECPSKSYSEYMGVPYRPNMDGDRVRFSWRGDYEQIMDRIGDIRPCQTESGVGCAAAYMAKYVSKLESKADERKGGEWIEMKRWWGASSALRLINRALTREGSMVVDKGVDFEDACADVECFVAACTPATNKEGEMLLYWGSNKYTGLPYMVACYDIPEYGKVITSFPAYFQHFMTSYGGKIPRIFDGGAIERNYEAMRKANEIMYYQQLAWGQDIYQNI